MNNSNEEIQQARDAAAKPVMLTRPADIARAAKSWRRSPLLGVDTEFVRERTYYAQLGLIQISDGHTVWLVDPLAVDELEPVADMLRSPDSIKIIHSASEDLEVLLQHFGCLPRPFFDTQLAAACVGQPLQMSYHAMADWLIHEPIDKGATRSNWCKRPLTTQQIHYAALDVCFLPLFYEMLTEQLNRLDRQDWVREDAERKLQKAESGNRYHYTRLPGVQTLNGEQLKAADALCRWRESVAITANRPRQFILGDKVLTRIARRRPGSIEDLGLIEELNPTTLKRRGRKLLTLLEQSRHASAVAAPPEPLGPQQRRRLKAVRETLREIASELDVEPGLLAAKRDMEHLIRHHENGNIDSRLHGWRWQLFGDRLVRQLRHPSHRGQPQMET